MGMAHSTRVLTNFVCACVLPDKVLERYSEPAETNPINFCAVEDAIPRAGTYHVQFRSVGGSGYLNGLSTAFQITVVAGPPETMVLVSPNNLTFVVIYPWQYWHIACKRNLLSSVTCDFAGKSDRCIVACRNLWCKGIQSCWVRVCLLSTSG